MFGEFRVESCNCLKTVVPALLLLIPALPAFTAPSDLANFHPKIFTNRLKMALLK